MGFSIKYIYEAVDRFTPTTEKIDGAVTRLKSKLKGVSKEMEKTGKEFKKLGEEMSLYVSAPIIGLGTVALESAGRIDELKTELGVMLRSTSKAQKLTDDLLKFRERSPFDFEDLAGAARRLVGFGIHTDAITKKLQFLGDISAGSHMSLTELSTIYGKVAARHRATLREIVQVNAQGIPIIEYLGKIMHKNANEIVQMATKNKISARDYEQAMMMMTAAGGKFHGMMAAMDETIPGIMSRFKNTLLDNLGKIALDGVKLFKLSEGVGHLADKLDHLSERFKALPESTRRLAFIGAAILAIAGPVMVFIGVFILTLRQLAFFLPIVTGPLMALRWALFAIAEVLGILTLPMWLWIVAIAAVGLAVYQLVKNCGSLRGALKTVIEDLKAMHQQTALQALVSTFQHLSEWAHDLGATLHWIVDAYHDLTGSKTPSAIEIWKRQSLELSSAMADQKAKAQVDININDPNNRATSVSAKASGPAMSLKVGRNMATGNLVGAH